MIGTKSRQFLIFLALLGISCVSLAETSAQDGHATLNTFVENRETTSSNAERSTTTAGDSQIGHSGGIPGGFGSVESASGPMEYVERDGETLSGECYRDGYRCDSDRRYRVLARRCKGGQELVDYDEDFKTVIDGYISNGRGGGAPSPNYETRVDRIMGWCISN